MKTDYPEISGKNISKFFTRRDFLQKVVSTYFEKNINHQQNWIIAYYYQWSQDS